MSLAYKLWRIGSVLDEDDVFQLMNENNKIPSDPQYLRVDFLIENNTVKDVQVNQKAVSKDRLFLTPKLGSSGKGIYYLYPNISLQKSVPAEKTFLLRNTLATIICSFANEANKKSAHLVLDAFGRVEKLCASYKKGDYVFYITINGQTLWECMPEVWEDWVQCPFIETDSLSQGWDVFTNESCTVGYQPDVKIFSYDNYHDALKYRLTKNYAFSAESARNIRFGWMFAMQNLFFKYNDLEYCVMPNMVIFDKVKYKRILLKYKEFHDYEKNRVNELFNLSNQEKKIEKELKKKEVNRDMQKVNDLSVRREGIQENKKNLYIGDIGFIKGINDDIDNLGDLSCGLVLNYYFFDLDRKSKSFRVKGSLEDVLPSRVQCVFRALTSNRITDAIIYYFTKTNDLVELKNYFSREEMHFLFSKRYDERKGFIKKYSNTILKERIYLARLLLADEQISMDSLLERFEYHREKDYAGKKRVKDGIKDWLQYPRKYRESEDRIIIFLKKLNKLRE